MKEQEETLENPPAFPKTGNFGEDNPGQYDSEDQNGMTLRDYFAAKAMQAYITHSTDGQLKEFSEASYMMADAMLKERNNRKGSAGTF